MSEFSERVKASLGRLRDQKTQLALASGIAVCVVIAAAVALPRSDEPAERAGETTTGPEASDAADDGLGASAKPGATSKATPSSGTIDLGNDVVQPPVASGGTIKVGIGYLTDPGAANAAAGFGGIGQIDQKRAWDTMLKEVNKANVFGRKVVPVWYAFSTDDVTSKGAQRLSQEMCARWTQDNKVFMVWGAGDDNLQACLTKAGVAQIGGLGGLSWSKTYKDFPYLASPDEAALDRMAEFEVDTLFDQGFFKEFKNNELPYMPRKPTDGMPRIGLIRYDQPSYKAGAAAMKKRLAAHGLSLCHECEFEISYSSDNIQEQLDDATEVNAAIQKCKSAGCTHMLFLGSTAGVRITLFFIDGAEKQQYRPMLGFNPLDAPTVVRDFLGASSYPQFRQSKIVSWSPSEFDEETAQFKKCRATFEKAGESFSGEEGSNKRALIPGYCDLVAFFIAASKAAGPTLSLKTWMQGVESVPVIPAAGTYGMQTKPGRHDGVGAVRVGAWADSCNCFKPSTGVLPV